MTCAITPEKVHSLQDMPQDSCNNAPIQSHSTWSGRVLFILNSWEKEIDDVMPLFQEQKYLDSLGCKIQDVVNRANAWVDKGIDGPLHMQLAVFVVKLPIRVVRNILMLVYFALKTLAYLLVHPLKTPLYIAKCLVALLESLTKAETWSKIGAGIIGSGVSQLILTGGMGPQAYAQLLLGSLILSLALIIGALSSLAKAPKGERFQAVLNHLEKQIKALPEAFLTGLLMGAMIGAIRTCATKQNTKYQTARINSEAAQARADYLREYYGITTPPSEITVNPDGSLTMCWKGENLHNLFINDGSNNLMERIFYDAQRTNVTHLDIKFLPKDLAFPPSYGASGTIEAYFSGPSVVADVRLYDTFQNPQLYLPPLTDPTQIIQTQTTITAPIVSEEAASTTSALLTAGALQNPANFHQRLG